MAEGTPETGQRQEVLINVYRQLWQHFEHMENERLWFTNIYGIVVVGILAALHYAQDFSAWLLGFGLILSILGVCYCVRIAYKQRPEFWKALDKTISDQGLSVREFHANIVPKSEEIRGFHAKSVAWAFVYFYSIAIVGLLALLVLNTLN